MSTTSFLSERGTDAVEADAGGAADARPEHLDVLIVGAGISGIGAAYYLKRDHPERSFALLEARGATGGTWDLFRYPGIRSDSDLHTFGYEFKPWRDEHAIAGADRILDYLRETAAENDIDRLVRFHRKVVGAAWDSGDARWSVTVENTESGERSVLTCGWLFCAGGYYRYDEGFTPRFEGQDDFAGQIVHPQLWPEDLEYAGKRVVVIGSGATAVTLIPSLAKTAAQVTMLQRTPSYVMPVGRTDPIAQALTKVFGAERGYALTRRKNIAQQRAVFNFCKKHPMAARRTIRWINTKMLPDGFPVDEHFSPPYNPWDQRLCAVPNGDLFRAIKSGRADVVTDTIARFTNDGIELTSGRHLEADIIVTATGLNVQAFGGLELTVDGAPVRFADTVAYKGMMLSGVPNFAFAIGYTNASWTLKVGLLCEHFGRLLSHMDSHGYDAVRPELPDPAMPTRPLLDFGAGYIQRAVDLLPRQGEQAPWVMPMDYKVDIASLRTGQVADPALRFERAENPVVAGTMTMAVAS